MLKKTELAIRWCSTKQMFLKISQNSQENTCVGVFVNKVESFIRTLFLNMRGTLSNYC